MMPIMPQIDQRPRLIKLIQIARRDLRLDDDTYRAMIRETTQSEKTSCTTLTAQQLERVLAHLKSRGFQIKPKTGSRPLADDAQSRKIRSLWLDLHQAGAVRDPSEKALARYIQRVTGGVSALQWLSTAQASTVIETLKKWLARLT